MTEREKYYFVSDSAQLATEKREKKCIAFAKDIRRILSSDIYLWGTKINFLSVDVIERRSTFLFIARIAISQCL